MVHFPLIPMCVVIKTECSFMRKQQVHSHYLSKLVAHNLQIYFYVSGANLAFKLHLEIGTWKNAIIDL